MLPRPLSWNKGDLFLRKEEACRKGGGEREGKGRGRKRRGKEEREGQGNSPYQS